MYRKIRNFIFKSGLIRFVAIFIRIRLIFKFNFSNFIKSIIWLIRREEFTNYMYEITKINRNQMVAAVAQVANKPITEVEKLFEELENDTEFANKLNAKSKKLKRSYELLFPIPYARRIVWYVLIRIYKPNVVVESGTEKGLGSLIIDRALEKNAHGQLFTLDIDIYAGGLLDAADKQRISLMVGDSVESLGKIDNVDFFIQDSNHSIVHEKLELEALEKKLTNQSVIISDNAHESNVLYDWSKKMGRNFLFVTEKSKNHWHPGDGIGISTKFK